MRIDEDVKQRFWPKVNKGGRQIEYVEGRCWEWTANKNNKGYGQLWIPPTMKLAHRISWEIHIGKIPKNLHVLHKCDNPLCVNPDHLFLGTHKENMQDMSNKGRTVIPGLRGEEHARSKLTEKQVRKIRNLHETGKYSQRELGEQFGVAHSTIGRIIRKTIWEHIN